MTRLEDEVLGKQMAGENENLYFYNHKSEGGNPRYFINKLITFELKKVHLEYLKNVYVSFFMIPLIIL